ncbi:MAG TPA: FKBP-type peptidyl-prolyl cis-trans isomerase [Prolixibacteraceae bacterium]|jgi:FKBP-type peptidyl-prolyl cis-trans isomerase
MKQILYVLGLAILLTGIFTSCKEDSLKAWHQDEVNALDKYVKENNLTRDASGIYFKLLERSADTTKIRPNFKVMLYYTITLMDSTIIFSTGDEAGHNYEADAFYVDVSNTVVNQSYVQQIAGMHLGLKKMHIGDRAFFVIPSELAFKAVDYSSTLGIPRFSTLLVTVFAQKGYTPEQWY